MKTNRTLGIGITLAIAALVAAAHGAQGEERSVSDKYGILLERSIFSRTRVRTVSRPPTTREVRPGEVLVLAGTASLGGGGAYIAFIENSGTGATTRASVGDSMGQGKVTAVGFDFLEYQSGGRTVRVAVGQNLEGLAPDRAALTGACPG